MTDTAPDISPDSLGDASDGAPDSGETPAEVTAVPEEAVLPSETIDEDGLALRIEEPDDPGTILVAVAEPPASYYDQAVPGDNAAVHAKETAQGTDLPPLKETAIPVYDDLTEVAAVRLPGLGPALFFLTRGIVLAAGDKVIVDMEDGQVLGETATVMRMNPEHLEAGDGALIKPIVRKATDKDIQTSEANEAVTREAAEFCRQCIRERNLDMKLVDVLTLHDRGKMVFYFTAPARIDFRELVKDLVRCYRTRIELRQIGVRHETQMVGALGNCGMVCCCRRYLRKFAPVAIKMAKEQNVFLNPVKISGICGRLLCCLAYEQDHYDEFYRSCPKLGKKYHTDAGVVRVLRASLFRESVTVLTETNEEIEYPLAEWNTLNPFRPNAPQQGQGAKRQEGREGGRVAGEDRNRRPPRDGQPPRQDRKQAEPEAPRGRESGPEHDALPAIVAEEESVVFVEKEDGVAVSLSQSRTEISFASAQEDDAPLPPDVDDDDTEDAGGSIFGLAPRREREAGHAPEDASRQESPRQDGPSQRKRRPHRRHGRKRSPNTESSS